MADESRHPAFFPQSVEVASAATTALILEILFGLFGVLGVGHAYGRRLGLAIVLFITWLVALLVVLPLIGMVTFGAVACLFVPIWIAVPIISGIQARSYILRTGVTGSFPTVFGFAGVGCLLVILAAVLSFFLLGVSLLGLITAFESAS